MTRKYSFISQRSRAISALSCVLISGSALILLFVKLHPFFLTHFAEGGEHIVVNNKLFVEAVELLIFIGQFLAVVFDEFHCEFDDDSFADQFPVIVRVECRINRNEVVRHDATSAVDGRFQFLGLHFSMSRGVCCGIHQFSVVEAVYQVFIVIGRAVIGLFLDATTGRGVVPRARSVGLEPSSSR